MESEFSKEAITRIELKPLYKGQWAERLYEGQELPVGGSLFSQEMTTMLHLDFSEFESDAENYTEQTFNEIFQEKKEVFEKWYKQLNCTLEPYLFFALWQVQQKMHSLLEVNPENPYESDSRGRSELYRRKKSSPHLSEFKKKSECAERAALGQWLLQRLGIESVYMSGSAMDNAKDSDEFPEPHSWLMVKPSNEAADYLIFDIARPKSQHSLPRILQPSVPVSYDLFKERRDGLIESTEVLQDRKFWFGVGEPAAGEHVILEPEK